KVCLLITSDLLWQMPLLHCPPERSGELRGLGEVWQTGLGKPGPLCIGRLSCINASEMGSVGKINIHIMPTYALNQLRPIRFLVTAVCQHRACL
uniref:Uncharacterized protein n=1 Tax=Anas zonorhyncha TaxID=75864 RepID=A0A8B9UDU5_9AVES